MENQGLGDLPIFEQMTQVPRPDVSRLVKEQDTEELDYQYMTKMYSAVSREALERIEEICDPLEYDGSSMFHEYLDRTQMLLYADQVYQKMKKYEKEDCRKSESILYQLIYVLLCSEVHHRRCRYRSKKCCLSCR